MNKTHAPFDTNAVTPEEIQRAIATGRRLQSEEIARLMRAAGSRLRNLAGNVLHVRVAAGGRTRPLAH